MIKGSEKRRVRNSLQIKKNNKNKRMILNGYRSNKNIYSQISDLNGNVLVAAGSNGKGMEKRTAKKSGIEIAGIIGEAIAQKALEKNIKEIVFNKGPYLYIGRVKALAEAARKAGLIF